MDQHPEASFGVPESPSRFPTAEALDEISPQGLADPVGSVGRLEEKADHICYLIYLN
jgi:hypothetical protein